MAASRTVEKKRGNGFKKDKARAQSVGHKGGSADHVNGRRHSMKRRTKKKLS